MPSPASLNNLLYIMEKLRKRFNGDFYITKSVRKELVDKLIEYQKFKEISKLIEEKEQESEWRIERKRKQINLPFLNDQNLWEEIDVWDLLRTFSSIISSISSERIIDLYEEVTVNEKLSLINEYLETKNEFFFTELIIKSKSIIEIVCAFLAVLEAVKTKTISLFQNRMFGDIRITTYGGAIQNYGTE